MAVCRPLGIKPTAHSRAARGPGNWKAMHCDGRQGLCGLLEAMLTEQPGCRQLSVLARVFGSGGGASYSNSFQTMGRRNWGSIRSTTSPFWKMRTVPLV